MKDRYRINVFYPFYVLKLLIREKFFEEDLYVRRKTKIKIWQYVKKYR